MIRFQSTEDRGGELTVTLTPFDIVSLEQGLTSAFIHLTHLKEENADAWEILGLESKLKDVEANLRELRRVVDDREKSFES